MVPGDVLDEMWMGELAFAVIAEAHTTLTKTDGVFSGAHAVELFELGLVNAL